MARVPPRSTPRRRAGPAARRWAALVCIPWALAGAAPAHASPILFAGGSAVPRPVQEFAWRVIETRCSYQAYERAERRFWAYGAQATRGDDGIVYSISVLSDVSWKKTEPPAAIAMTVVDDGGLRLAGLRSTFVVCAPDPR